MALGKTKISQTERLIIFLSLFIIIILAILMQYSQAQVYSILTLFVIIIIVIGNAIYIYNKYKTKK